MIINDIKIDHYKEKLSCSLNNSKASYKEKEYFIIQIHSDDYIGLGEVSPLNFFSKETVNDVKWALESLKEAISFNSLFDIDEIVNMFAVFCKDVPSLNFALDTAIYDILSQRKNIPLAKLFSSNCANQIKFSSILNQHKSINTIKMKIGLDIVSEIETLKSISNNNDLSLRLDANQFFDLETLNMFLKQINNANIQYIEEPFKSPTIEMYQNLKSNHNIKVAIDESIYCNDDYRNWVRNDLIDYAVIKPSIYGSFASFFELVDFFNKYNVDIVLSSSLESSIGNMATIHLASILNNSLSHGLNIFSFFDNHRISPLYDKNSEFVKIVECKGLGLSL